MPPLFDIGAGALYGLSANVAPPPLSALISIAMIFGVDYLGLKILRLLKLERFSGWQWLRWQAVLVGAAILGLFAYPMALAGFLPRFNAQIIAVSLAAVGVVHGGMLLLRNGSALYRRALDVLIGRTKFNGMPIIFWATFVGLGLLALGPITDADSLDYHAGVALDILNTGSFPYSPEWFHSRLAGSGEVLIALGLSVGAEQFGSLLQFSGVIGVVGIFRHGFITTKKWRQICVLSVVTTPLLVAWVASSKPMLLPVAMTTGALMLVLSVLGAEKPHANQDRRNIFALICLLVMTAAVTKMNFMLSGAVIGLVALLWILQNGDHKAGLAIVAAMATVIVGPQLAWKCLHYGGHLLSGLVTPFPGNWPGTKNFEEMLRAHRETTIAFPISLLIPNSFGNITTILGAGLFVALSALIRSRSGTGKILVVMVVAVALLEGILGQKSARFFVEPYLWLLMLSMLQSQPENKQILKIAFYGLLAQGSLMLGMIIVGIATLTSGAMSVPLHESTMIRHASGYSEMKWADSILPSDARLLVRSRFIAIAPRFAVASDWQSYIPVENEQAGIYEELTVKKAPTFLLFSLPLGDEPRLNNCDGEIYSGPFHTKAATRNPLNSGAAYDAWIIRLNRPGAECKL